MSDLVAFLRARLDEDEAAARDYPDGMDGRWYQVPTYTPARVLREVEAERAILTEHLPTDWTAYGDHMCRRCIYSDDEPHDELHHWVAYPCLTVRALLAVYRDHPDYDPAWEQ